MTSRTTNDCSRESPSDSSSRIIGLDDILFHGARATGIDRRGEGTGDDLEAYARPCFRDKEELMSRPVVGTPMIQASPGIAVWGATGAPNVMLEFLLESGMNHWTDSFIRLAYYMAIS